MIKITSLLFSAEEIINEEVINERPKRNVSYEFCALSVKNTTIVKTGINAS
tara:strand:+ start:283 stop:435 length:153 start_codon:yes stop_codon:yes gene_type:complete